MSIFKTSYLHFWKAFAMVLFVANLTTERLEKKRQTNRSSMLDLEHIFIISSSFLITLHLRKQLNLLCRHTLADLYLISVRALACFCCSWS